MITILRTDSTNSDFFDLYKQLDAYLAERNGTAHSFYDQFNKVDHIKHVVVLYDNETPVGCGAIKEYSAEAMEVKRMYTLPERRGKGIASAVLKELEKWSAELGYTKCVLETGNNLEGAVVFYPKSGYTQIPNYGQYVGVENSVCFEKVL
jgi:putative acetyltransferase